MELLDMVPAHAIALRLYSLPAAVAAMGSLCAWLVAALAAAVGLWRIRAVGAFKAGAGVRGGSARVEEKKAQVMAPLPPPTIDEPRPAVQAEAAEPASPSVEPRTPSKVRFTAYYGGSGYDEGVVDGVRNCADADEDGARGGEGEVKMILRRTASEPGRRSTVPLAVAPWEEMREMAVRWRGDLGLYRNLDMAVLDGSVVRLWDGELTTASPVWRRGRAGSEFQLSL